MAKLGTCGNNCMKYKAKIFLSGPLQKELPASDLDYVTVFFFYLDRHGCQQLGWNICNNKSVIG